MAKIEIRTKKQLRAVKNEIARKQMINIMKIIISEKVAWEVTTIPRNLLNVEIKEGLLTNGIAEFTIDNFTDDVISVEFRAGGRNKQEILEKASLFYAAAIKIAGKNSDIVALIKRKDEIVGYSLVTKKGGVVALEDLKKRGYNLYVAGAYSASEARKYSTTLYKVEFASKELASKLDKLTYGAYGILEGSEMTLEEMQKAAARMGQWKTGMSHTEECGLVAAFYVGKWEIDGTQYADGKAYLRDVKVAEVLSNEKYEIVRNAVEGILVQCRPFSVCKTEAKITNSDYIKEKVLFDAGKKDNIIWINREEVTPEQQREFNNIFIKGANSEFKGKVIIIKPKEVKPCLKNIDFYTDLNGLKSSYDLRLDSGLNILALDKPLKGRTVNTNTQQLETLAMADPVATKKILKDIATSFNKANYYGTINAKAKVPSIKEIQQMYTSGIVKNIAPKFSLQNKKVFGAIADQAVQGMVKAVNGLNYKIPGQNRIMQMDFGAEFGVRILEPETCFVPGIKEKWILGTRNPKQHTGEFLLFKNLTIKEVVALIREKVQDRQLQNLLIREYRLLSDSSVVVPAIEEIKDAIGGADVDGDTLTLVSHRKLIAIIKRAIKAGRIKSTAIQVETPKIAQERDMKFSLQAIHTAFVKLITNGNLSIGEITYMNNYFLGLLYDLLAGRSEAAIEFFKSAFVGNNGSGTDAYLPLNRKILKDINMNKIYVSFDEMNRVVQNIKTMELTPANMIQALDDLNAIFMALQMETIDAPKKGTRVPVPFAGMLNKFQQASKTKIDIDLGIRERGDIDENYKVFDGIKYLVEQRSGWVQEGVDKNGEPIMKYIHQDLLHEIRVEIAREVMRIARVLKRKHDSTRYSEDIANHFITAKDRADEKLVRDMIELKKIYNSINAGVIKNEEEAPFYKTYIAALANTIRIVTQNLTDIERAVLAEAISIPASDHGSKYSSFAMNTLKEEYLKMVIENFAEIDVAGEPLMVRKNVEEGDVLSFNFGVAKDGDKLAATRADISGEFVIRKINDRYYATKKIVDLIPEVELTNDIVFRMDFDAHSKEARKALLEAETVEFKIVFGKGNLVFADGKQIGKFITVSGMTELNALYDGAVGKVKNVMVVEEITNNGTAKNMLVGIMELDNDSTPDLEGEEMEFFEF